MIDWIEDESDRLSIGLRMRMIDWTEDESDRLSIGLRMRMIDWIEDESDRLSIGLRMRMIDWTEDEASMELLQLASIYKVEELFDIVQEKICPRKDLSKKRCNK